MVHLSRHYLEAVAEAGGWPVVLPVLDDGVTGPPSEILTRIDALVLTGSDPPLDRHLRDRPVVPPLDKQAPRRFHSDVLWLREALAAGLPVLAICRGMQTLNVALGGSIWPRLYPPEQAGQHDQVAPGDQPCHEIRVEPDSLLAAALGKTVAWANSFHVQGVKDVAPGLRVTARSPDGVIETVEPDRNGTGRDLPWLLGVQWHPEGLRTTDPAMRGIFDGLVRAAQARMKLAGHSWRVG